MTVSIMNRLLLIASAFLFTMSIYAQQRPNIILIMSDDHAQQSISAYDTTYIRTPNIDRLANEGAIFENSFCTNSICAPSRAVILTGKHSNINGQVHNGIRFDSSQVTFPKMLQAAGYRTGMIGKWHLQSQPTGFDYWVTMHDQGRYYNPEFIYQNGVTKVEEGYATNLITDKSLQWIDEVSKGGQPFCLLLYHKAPHRNWMPDTADLNLFRGKKYPLPGNFYDSYNGRVAAAAQEMSIAKDMLVTYDLKMYDPAIEDTKWSIRNYVDDYSRFNPAQKAAWDKEYKPVIDQFIKNRPTGKALSEWKYQRYMEDYLRTVASIDKNIGRVLQYLDNHNLANNTIVIYTSDQGMYLGEHGWFDKRFMYEESLHMPLLMRYPGHIQAGTHVMQMVQNLDFAPTLLDFAGVKPDPAMQGVSFKKIVEGKSKKWRDAIYYHYYEYPGFHSVKRHYGVRTDRYKLIHFYYNIDVWEFYDLKTDPHEMHNEFNNPVYAKQINKLKKKLQKLREQYKDTAEDNFRIGGSNSQKGN